MFHNILLSAAMRKPARKLETAFAIVILREPKRPKDLAHRQSRFFAALRMTAIRLLPANLAGLRLNRCGRNAAVLVDLLIGCTSTIGVEPNKCPLRAQVL